MAEDITLTLWQETFITLGFIYRNYEATNKKSFWNLLKNNGCVLDVVVYCYGALAAKKEIISIDKLRQENPTLYEKYTAGAKRFDSQASESKINKIVMALHVFTYLRSN